MDWLLQKKKMDAKNWRNNLWFHNKMTIDKVCEDIRYIKHQSYCNRTEKTCEYQGKPYYFPEYKHGKTTSIQHYTCNNPLKKKIKW